MLQLEVIIGGNNDIREYHEYLLQNNYSYEDVRNQIARYMAKVSYAIMKYKTDYRPYQCGESKVSLKDLSRSILRNDL